MASRRDVLTRPGATALSAVALYFATGLQPSWWLAWIAPIPVLAAVRGSGRLAAFLMGLGAWLLGSLNLWTYLRGVIGLPLAVIVPFLLLPAVAFGLTALVFRALAARQRSAAAALAVPAAWTTFEYLLSVTSPHGTFGSLAYTQSDALPVIQIASATGIWGISFLLLIASASAAMLLPPSRGAWRAAACVAGIVLTNAGWGAWRVHTPAAAAPAIAIGVAAVDQRTEPLAPDEPMARATLDAYLRTVDALGADGVDLVVLPETIVRLHDSDAAAFEAPLRLIAARRHVDVVVGVARGSDGVEHNAALTIRADATAATYYKRHLIPGLEARYQPGRDVTVLRTAGAAWGIAVCKDLDFPGLGREYGARGVALLAVPAWDFGVDGWLHGRMAVVRGIESGFAVARSARDGRLTVSDARGRLLADARSGAAEPVSAVAAHVPLEHVETIYRRFGDWFAWVSMALLCATLVQVGRPRRLPSPQSVPALTAEGFPP